MTTRFSPLTYNSASALDAEAFINAVGEQEATCNQNGLCDTLYACLHLSDVCSDFHVRRPRRPPLPAPATAGQQS